MLGIPFYLLLLGTVLSLEQQQWRTLETRSELQQHDLVLCLSAVPWCGESRSFMQEMLEQLKQAGPDEFLNLQLRYVNTHKHSNKAIPQDIPFATGHGPYLTLFRHGTAYKYTAMQLLPHHVIASLRHAVATSDRDIPFQYLESAKQVQEFVDFTDKAFILVDLCGWTVKPNRAETLVEDSIETGDNFGEFVDTRASNFNNSLGEDRKFCSAADEQIFGIFYENLTQVARASFLTPHSAKFGIVTSLDVVGDAKLDVPRGKPWVLARQTKDIARSWSFLHDARQLGDFLANTTVLVDEVNVTSKFLNTKAAVLLFIDRGSYLQDDPDENMKALETVREVARKYAGLDPLAFSAAFGDAKNKLDNLLVKLDSLVELMLEDDGSKQGEEDLAETIESVELQDEEGLGILLDGSEETLAHDESMDIPLENSADQVLTRGETSGPIFFGFFDGVKALEESLTGKNSGKPSIVVIFPGKQEYFVYPKDMPLDANNLMEFLNRTLSGSSRSFTRSGPNYLPPREPLRPPFVNLDFQEVSGIPRVNLDRILSEVVRNHVWDSVVLFTLPWCGFCKRMEVGVREVHRYFKNYFRNSCAGLTSSSTASNCERFQPLEFFQMECLENDCSQLMSNILKDDQGYPLFVLFPAKGVVPVVYRGPPTVGGIFEFVASRGKSAFEGSKMEPSNVQIGVTSKQQKAENNKPSEEMVMVQIAPGQVLVATEKLTGSPLFEGSQILIVSADDHIITGLIINKQIEWDDLPDIEDELKNITKGSFLSRGGPVFEHPKHVFSLTRKPELQGFVQVCDEGLFVGSPDATQGVFKLIQENMLSTDDFRFIAGQCGWTWSQIQQELQSGYWNVMQCGNATRS